MRLKIIISIVLILFFSSLNIVTAEEGDTDAIVDCNGSISLIEVEEGSVHTDSFTITNSGPADSVLDWTIESWPTWAGSNFDFSQRSGTGLLSGDTITITVEITAPYFGENDQDYFHGEIKVKNQHCSCYPDSVPVTIDLIHYSDYDSVLSVSGADINLGPCKPNSQLESSAITIRNEGEQYSKLYWTVTIAQEYKDWIKVSSIQGPQYMEVGQEATISFKIIASAEYDTLRQGTDCITIRNENEDGQEVIFDVSIQTKEDESIRAKCYRFFSFLAEKFQIFKLIPINFIYFVK